MNKQDVINRTQCLALRCIRMVDNMPITNTSRILGNQLVRSATSIGANYRASCRAKSKKDFISKLKIVEEEADETIYWLELIEQAKILDPKKLEDLTKEANELLSIFVTSIKTAKSNLAKTIKVRS